LTNADDVLGTALAKFKDCANVQSSCTEVGYFFRKYLKVLKTIMMARKIMIDQTAII